MSRSAARPACLVLAAVAAALLAAPAPASAAAAPAPAQEPPRLLVTFTDGDAHPLRGETFRYRATIRNEGTQTLRAARLVAVVPDSEVRLLPASVTTDAGQVTIGNVFGSVNNLISIELGALTPGEQLEASWRVRVRADLPAGLESFGAAAVVERTADDGYPSTIAGDYDLTTEPATALTADLSGAGVVPGPGDRDGSGTARLRVVPATGALCSTVVVRRTAVPGRRTVLVAGDQRVVLAGPGAGGTAQGCTTVEPGLARALVTGTDPYVQVENAAFPAGALRGPLRR